MPLQNRVTPFGEIVAVPERGTMMGNRGRIHDENQNLTGQLWDRKAWISCRLDFRGRKREVMAPSTYTELFFLDEVTAMAAGHRPCGTCRRAESQLFRNLWLEVNAELIRGKPGTMFNLDAILHAERVSPDGAQRRWRARISELPDGVVVALEKPGAAFLLSGG